MKTHRITGSGGVQLNVVESGNPRGRPILFLHGALQCSLQWSRQLDSSLTEDHRLVAIDMRGHGMSDKPRDAYADSKQWADDVDAVIGSLALDRPVLSGWSYGSLVGLDYVRHYGESAIGGLHFVGAVTQLGTDAALEVLSPGALGIFPQLLAGETENTAVALQELLRLCFAHPPADAEFFRMLVYNVSVPPFVRQGLFSRSLTNDDLLPQLRKPVLISHGTLDAVVKPSAVEQHKRAIPHAEVHLAPDAGHAVFWDDAAGFNARLHEFCENIS
jgi:pimeloyl-ACP methyl ester carboxylesterase